MIVDIWLYVHSMFEGSAETTQEIRLSHLNPQQMRACVLFLLEDARECNTQFVIAGTQTEVYLASADAVVEHILAGDVTGALWVNFSGMPPIGVYIDAEDMLSITYIRGEWTPLSVMVLFDLLYRLKNIAPDAHVQPDDILFDPNEQEKFVTVWQSYVRS